MENNRTNEFIVVTYFINPQLFWYHDATVPSPSYSKVREIEEKYGRFYKSVQNLIQIVPNVGDKCVALYSSWNQYIRVEIIKKNDNDYVVWALDHGFPFPTELKFLRYLPEEFKLPIDHIRRGGMANLLPAERDYDLDLRIAVMKKEDNWSPRAIEGMQKYIKSSHKIIFVEQFTSKNGHIWGDLKVVADANQTFCLREYLLGASYAIESSETIKDMSLDAVLTEITKNFFKKITAILDESTDDLHCHFRRKVDDWRLLNESECIKMARSSHESVIEDAQFIDDIAFEDSVSVAGNSGANIAKTGIGSMLKENLPEFDYKDLSEDSIYARNLNIDFQHAISDKSSTICSRNVDDNFIVKDSNSPPSRDRVDKVRRMYGLEQIKAGENGASYKRDDSVEQKIASRPMLTSGEEEQHIIPKCTELVFTNSSVVSSMSSKVSDIRKKIKSKLILNDNDDVKEDIPKISVTRPDLKALKRRLLQKNPETLQTDEFDQFNGTKILPAVIDMTKHNKSNDEGQYWHCNRSTCYDNVPQANLASDQNFRFTRAHTDKYKNVDQNMLDREAVPAKIETPMCPVVATGDNKLKSSQNLNPVVKVMKENHSPRPEFTSCPNTRTENYIPAKYKKLKAPNTQMHVIDNILKNANLEKRLGNTDILDLDSLNGDSNDKNNSPNPTVDNDKNAMPSNTSALTSFATANCCIVDDYAAGQDNVQSGGMEAQTKLPSCEQVGQVINFPLSKQLKIVEGESVVPRRYIDHFVMAHSTTSLNPIDKVEEATFIQEIHEGLSMMRVNKVFRLQAYSWPHVLRNNSLFIVNPRKTGKTLCYLPAVCSLVVYRIENNIVPTSYGPVAIILVPSATHVEQMYNYCMRILVKLGNVGVVRSFGKHNLINTKMELLNGCGILITTPASFLRLTNEDEQESFVDPKRLQHFVIDDMCLMLSRSEEDFHNALKLISKITSKSKLGKLPIQFIVTSTEWSKRLMSLVQMSNAPLLLIGDFLEAAVYGRTFFSIKMQNQAHKIEQIKVFLKKNSNTAARFLIFCNSDRDVAEVAYQLTELNYDCITYVSNSSVADLLRVTEWKKSHSFSRKVLICTDATFAELQIKNVTHIIHYTMASTWTRFTSRFAALYGCYENFVRNNFEFSNITNTLVPKSLILLDAENSENLPRLLDFIRRHERLESIHETVVEVSKNVVLKREEARSLQGICICPYVLEFGICSEARCDYRHFLTEKDSACAKDELPIDGDMRIVVLKVHSPTHYVARLLQHKPPNSDKWHNLRRSNEAVPFAMRVNLYYHTNEWTLHYPMRINDLCIYKKNEQYFRARIIKEPEIAKDYHAPKRSATIKLVDEGSVIETSETDALLVCVPEFRDFPEQAIDMRLNGVVPFDNERTWDSRTTKCVETWLTTDITKTDCVRVMVDFVIANTIYVNNVIILEKLATLRNYTYRVNIKRSLLVKELAVLRNPAIKSVREVAEDCGMLKKYTSKCCTNAAATNTSTQLIESNKKYNIGNRDKCTDTIPVQQQSITKATQNDVTTPKADELIQNTKNLSLVEKSVILKEKWCKLPLQQIVKVEIGDEDENGNWSDIYLQCIDASQIRLYHKLKELIYSHINNLKSQPQMPFADDWFKPMQNCIIKYETTYVRAKLYNVIGKDCDERKYRFFLCDFACFAFATETALYNDYLYASTDKIVQFTPFQAVHCTLAGIQLKANSETHKITKDSIYAYAVSQRTILPCAVASNMQINSYEVLLYETELENDFGNSQMLNKDLITKGIAILDSNMSDYLNVQIDISGQISRICPNDENANNVERLLVFDEFLQCMEEAFQNGNDNNNAYNNDNKTNVANVCEISELENDELAGDENAKKEIVPAKGEVEDCHTDQNAVNVDDTLNMTVCLSQLVRMVPIYCPETKWEETDYYIIFLIHAPDVTTYYLHVTEDSLYYLTVINNKRQQILLNLLGTIDPEQTLHEIRGLNVVVRLLKTVFVQWPRVLKEDVHYEMLKFNFDALSTDDTDDIDPEESLSFVSERVVGTYSSSSDSEEEPYETYPPILTSVDEHDPTAEI